MGKLNDESRQCVELKSFFISWRRLVQLQEKNREQDSSVATSEPSTDSPNIDPWAPLDTAARIPAKNLQDLLFKLAFRRWSKPDLGPTFDKIETGDAVIYSAFRDRVDLTQEDDVMTKLDQETNLMRGAVRDA